MDLTFNAVAGRFADERGRFVSEARVRQAVDQIADTASARLTAASTRLLAGELSLASWQVESMATVKSAHLATSTIANGGAARMGFSEYGRVGNHLRGEYAYMRDMAAQIADGRQPLNGSLTARAAQYGQGVRVTYERERGRGQAARGYTSERNRLSSSEHCSQCREQTARGWQPIGTLVPVGRRLCRGNCRCSVEYSREAAKAA